MVRWGSGEVRIERVELLDAAGSSRTRVNAGDEVAFRFHYRAAQPVDDAVIGMAIETLGGVEVAGVNTRQSGLIVGRLMGEGFVDLRIPQLPLLEGTYDVTAAIYDRPCLHAYDHVQRLFRFDVAQAAASDEVGLVSLGAVWGGDGLVPLSARERSA